MAATVTLGYTFTDGKANDLSATNLNKKDTVTMNTADFDADGDISQVAAWKKVATINASDLDGAATTETEDIYTLTARTRIHAAFIYVVTEFDGGDDNNLTVQVGISGDTAKYVTATQIHTDHASTITEKEGVDQVSGGIMESSSGSTTIQALFTNSTDDPMTDITTGKLDIYLLMSRLPAFSSA